MTGAGRPTPLPGFDENAYVAAGGFDQRLLGDLLAELAVVRAATIALLTALDDASAQRRGTANGGPVTPRAIAHVIAGHELHHRAILAERYGIGAAG